MTPFFSVVVTVFNKEQFITSTINSVLQQSFTSFELIVVNDGSSDNSWELINSFKDDRLVAYETENCGAAASRNFGISKAKGAYLAFLDGDDLWLPNYLESFRIAIKNFDSSKVFACALGHKFNNVISRPNYGLNLDKPVAELDFFESSLKASILSSSSVIINKSIIESVGLFNESLKTGEDLDYWIRLGLRYKIIFINEVLAVYLYNRSSLSNRNFDVSKKPNFTEYKQEELKNDTLKKYLDLNRYSFALMARINNQDKEYAFFKSELTQTNLSIEKRLLLNSPKWVLEFLLKIRSFQRKKLYYKPTDSLKSL